MLQIIACLLAGTACLLGAFISSSRTGNHGGMVEQPDHLEGEGRVFSGSATSTALIEASNLPTKARGIVEDHSLATRVRADGQIMVGGQVISPGPQSLTSCRTLASAVARAGGATEFGSMRRITLIRNGQATDYNLAESPGDIALMDGDTIEVCQKMMVGR